MEVKDNCGDRGVEEEVMLLLFLKKWRTMCVLVWVGFIECNIL
jgi:hypothetical protein